MKTKSGPVKSYTFIAVQSDLAISSRQGSLSLLDEDRNSLSRRIAKCRLGSLNGIQLYDLYNLLS